MSAPARSVHTYTAAVNAEGISEQFVRRVADELRARYDLDEEDMRALGARLADVAGRRSTENLAFAERFSGEHHETFDRLGE
jgi:hypothetical protein